MLQFPSLSVLTFLSPRPTLLVLPFYHLPIPNIGILVILPNLFCLLSLVALVMPVLLHKLLALGSLVGKAILPTPVSIADVVALSLPSLPSYPIQPKRYNLPRVRARRIDFRPCRFKIFTVSPAPTSSIYVP